MEDWKILYLDFKLIVLNPKARIHAYTKNRLTAVLQIQLRHVLQMNSEDGRDKIFVPNKILPCFMNIQLFVCGFVSG